MEARDRSIATVAGIAQGGLGIPIPGSANGRIVIIHARQSVPTAKQMCSLFVITEVLCLLIRHSAGRGPNMFVIMRSPVHRTSFQL